MVKIFLALPPIEEQKAIVQYLDVEISKLDSLNKKVEQAIGLLRERRSALITAAVTGQIDVHDAISQAASDSQEALAA